MNRYQERMLKDITLSLDSAKAMLQRHSPSTSDFLAQVANARAQCAQAHTWCAELSGALHQELFYSKKEEA